MFDVTGPLHIKDIHNGLSRGNGHGFFELITSLDSGQLMRIYQLGQLFVQVLPGVGVNRLVIESGLDSGKKQPAYDNAAHKPLNHLNSVDCQICRINQVDHQSRQQRVNAVAKERDAEGGMVGKRRCHQNDKIDLS